MTWAEICITYPNQWLIIEALEAYTDAQSQRILSRIAVIESCGDGAATMKRYRELHSEYPSRELYFVHTSRQNLDIQERHWLGVRRGTDYRIPNTDYWKRGKEWR
ncbi:MAG: hypothetical protein KC423_10160 [Anaerolineales bacterium]|nr:hypothetical protein [Anaerolineales bacterium]MCB9433999.1 hypothetical protein [Ardenticatenaceae bacterium]